MSEEQATRAITLEIELDAPKEQVWRALTTAEGIASWFPPISDGSGAKVGDKLLISWGKEMEWWTTVSQVDEGRHIRWGDESSPLVTDWYLETRKGKTVLRLVNSGFGADAKWDDHFDATEAGWKYFLFNLKHALERHPGTPRAYSFERRPSTQTRPEVWSKLESELLPSAGTIRLGSETLPVVVENKTEGRGMWLRLPSVEDALMFIEMEPGREKFHTGMWLSTYGVPEERVASLRAGLHESADRIFG